MLANAPGHAPDLQSPTCSESLLGETKSADECADLVKRAESRANGATWKPNVHGMCSAWFGMTTILPAERSQTCYLSATPPQQLLTQAQEHAQESFSSAAVALMVLGAVPNLMVLVCVWCCVTGRLKENACGGICERRAVRERQRSQRPMHEEHHEGQVRAHDLEDELRARGIRVPEQSEGGSGAGP